MRPLSLCVMLGLTALGFFIPQISRADEVLHNDTIIQLQSYSLGDAVILAKIKSTKCDFDTSPDALIRLKAAHVSDDVIREMLAVTNPSVITNPPATPSPVPSQPAQPASPVMSDPNNPAIPHAPGIWVLREMGGKKILTQLIGEPAIETRRGGWIGPWGIGKIAETAHLSAQSDIQLNEKRPTFYFYLGHPSPGMAPTYNYDFYNGIGPKDLKLAQFKVINKKSDRPAERVLEVSRVGAYAGSSGIATRDARDFSAESIGDGIYKIVPKSDLVDGEYAFCPPYIHVEHSFYTFGIKTK